MIFLNEERVILGSICVDKYDTMCSRLEQLSANEYLVSIASFIAALMRPNNVGVVTSESIGGGGIGEHLSVPSEALSALEPLKEQYFPNAKGGGRGSSSNAKGGEKG